MKTVAMISQKGGSGKTTVAVHLAVCAELAGKRSAIIDLDPQASALEWGNRRQAETPEVVRATPEQLAGLLKLARANEADIAIIDTAPHSDRAATIAAGLADVILIPCRPGSFRRGRDSDNLGHSQARQPERPCGHSVECGSTTGEGRR